MSQPQYKAISIKPMTGLLDVRSLPELMGPGTWRLRQNFSATEENRLCRRTGWERLLPQRHYNNQDLHDQLLPLQQYYGDIIPPTPPQDVTSWPSPLCGSTLFARSQGREIPTLLFQSVSTAGYRRLICGTQSRVYELNENTGNWRILGDGFGGVTQVDLSIRFKAAQVKDTVIFTNGYDPVQAYTLSSPITGCAMAAMHSIPDLDVISLQTAKVVHAYKNVIFLADVQMDGQQLQNRIVWSDYNNGTSFDPAVSQITGEIASTLTGHTLTWSNPAGLSVIVQSRTSATAAWKEVQITTADSLVVSDLTLQYRVATFVTTTTAGFQDLSYGHKILGMINLGDFLMVLTDKSIWQGTPTGLSPGQGPAFSFRVVYQEEESGDKCLAYSNTLVSIGGSVMYLGRDALYLFNFDQYEPEKVEWIHKATGAIYNGILGNLGINEQCCESPVACYRPNQKEVWISWPVQGSCVPSQTLVINVERKVVDTVDAGFSAYVNFISDDRLTLREFLLHYCICNLTSLAQNGILFQKEGLPLPDTQFCPFIPDSIYTTQTRPINAGDPSNEWMEDFTKDPSAHSICSALGDLSTADFCRDCNQTQLFVAASVTDYCLKQIGTSYNRERCTNPTDTSTSVTYVDANGLITYQSNIGKYTKEGYYSILRSGPIDYGVDSLKKTLIRVLLDVEAQAQTTPCVVQVRIGVSYSPIDPNLGYQADPNRNQNASNGCGFLWQTTLRKLLQCQLPLSPRDMVAQNLVPNLGTEWATFNQGRYYAYEILIADLAGSGDIATALLNPGKGGASCFGQLEAWLKPNTT